MHLLIWGRGPLDLAFFEWIELVDLAAGRESLTLAPSTTSPARPASPDKAAAEPHPLVSTLIPLLVNLAPSSRMYVPPSHSPDQG